MPGPLPVEMPISVEASVRHMFGLKRRLYLSSYRGKTEAKKRSGEAAFHAANAAWAAGAYTRDEEARLAYERALAAEAEARRLEKERQEALERGRSQEEKDRKLSFDG